MDPINSDLIVLSVTTTYLKEQVDSTCATSSSQASDFRFGVFCAARRKIFTMPKKKKILGKDAVCECYGRFLHPSVHVRTRYPNMNKTKKFIGLVVVRLEQKKIRNADAECVILTSNDFIDNDGGYIEMYCNRRYINIEVEGPSYSYFGTHNNIQPNVNDEEMLEVEPPIGDDIMEFVSRTATINFDDEDVQELQGVVEIDNDNDPAPENIPNNINNECFYKDEWGHSGICNRKIVNGATEHKAFLNFPTSFSPTLVDMSMQ